MNRKLAVLIAAIIIPGGLVALVSAWLMRSLANTERGRRVVGIARARGSAVLANVRKPVLHAPRAA